MFCNIVTIDELMKPITIGIEIELGNVLPRASEVHIPGIQKYLKPGEIIEEAINNPLNSVVIEKLRKSKLIYSSGHDGGGIEFALVPMTAALLKKNDASLRKIFDLLKFSGYAPERSTSAGMHVHIGKSAFTAQTLIKMVTFFCTYNSIISTKIFERMQGHSYAQQGKFDKRVSALLPRQANLPEALRENSNLTISSDNGAICINRKGVQTIEFRMFQSTVDWDKILGRVEFLTSLLRYCSALRTSVDPDLGAYMEFLKMNKNKYPNCLHLFYSAGIIPRTAATMRLLVE